MKTIISFASLLFVLSAHAQKLNSEYGLGYTFMVPGGSMKHHIRNGHGLTGDYYVTPAGKRFAYGVELNYTQYGREKTNQLYSFSDGTSAPMDIYVYNGITSLALGIRYFLREEGTFRPFVTGKPGYSWFRTTLNIYDPDDTDHCAPVETDLLMKDGTFFLSGGIGFQYDLTRVFTHEESNRLVLTMSVNVALGGTVRYMNVDAPGHHHATGDEVMAQFINTQTQVIHPHHVGYVYQSGMQMTDFRIGLIFRR